MFKLQNNTGEVLLGQSYIFYNIKWPQLIWFKQSNVNFSKAAKLIHSKCEKQKLKGIIILVLLGHVSTSVVRMLLRVMINTVT